MLRVPTATDAINPRPCLVANPQHLEHALERLVPAFADAALKQLLTRHEQCARVGELHPVDVAVDDHAPLSGVVSVDERIDQCLLKRFVHVGAGLSVALGIQEEGSLQPRPGSELQDDALVELEQVGLHVPSTVTRSVQRT